MTNVVTRAVEQAIGGMDVKRVFGEPIERDGVIYLPAAKVRGGEGAVVTPRAMEAPGSG